MTMPTRRQVLQMGAAGGVASMIWPAATSAAATDVPDEVDYIVVGSGPGGSPVAARLAEAGHSVALLEAGPAHGNDTYYSVPALWPRTCEDDAIQWDYYVRHYTDASLHGDKFLPEKDGVLYPRASTLGGCAAHHAMVTISPSPLDWQRLQQITGDATFDPDAMWGHWNSVRGWQPVEQNLPVRGGLDLQIDRLFASAVADTVTMPKAGHLKLGADPNSYLNATRDAQGFFVSPQSGRDGRRVSPRERLLGAARENSGLRVITESLVERVLFEQTPGGEQRAVGVSLLAAPRAYAASVDSPRLTDAARASVRRTIRARKEVILSAGCFNSPQLLMLSGIGPAAHLRAMDIPVRVDLPGVGTNFQDRLEAPVVTRLDSPFTATVGCELTGAADDRFCMAGWQAGDDFSVYGSNGAPFFIRRAYSKSGTHVPEIALLGVLGEFYGFKPGWVDKALATPSQHFTWIVVKAYARGKAGTVRLRSGDPTATPVVNKRSLMDGRGDPYDLGAVREGIETARRINRRALIPGEEVAPGVGADLDSYIRKEQFGHHGACTNPIGAASDPMAVLDSKHRVRGTRGLRVVDASAFNEIPGSFIWAPTAVLAERAASEILKEA